MKPTKDLQSEMPAAAVILPSTGFAVMGLFAFGLTCVILLLRPETLSGDPVRGSVLALTHLVTLGWIGSLLIAGAYLIGPVLAGSPLWSRKLPTVHLVCHSVGLALLLGGLAVLRYDVAGAGALALVVGLGVLILNLLMTSLRRSLWTPANLAFQSALFWLAITGCVALLMLHARATGRIVFLPEMLIALHAHYALFGFLAQAMLGVSLRLLPGLNDPAQEKLSSTGLSWMGWSCLNTGLLILFPTVYSGSEIAVTVAAALIGLGVLGFAGEIGVVLLRKHTHRSWGTWTHATGVLLLVLIMAVAIWNFPRGAAAESAALREWMRIYISLSLLGPFAFTILGTGERILPRLVWQLRFAPWKSFGALPPPDSLGLRAAGGPVYFSLILACDMCNVSFGRQLENERSGSLIARDFFTAVKNQGTSLASSGLGSGAFKPASIHTESTPVLLAQAEVETPVAIETETVAEPEGEAAETEAAETEVAPDVSEQDEVPGELLPALPARPGGMDMPDLARRFGGSYGQVYDTVPDAWKDDPFIDIIERDYNLPIPATSYVPQDTPPDKTFTIRLSEGQVYIGNGVVYDGFLTNDTVPGPLVLVDEGDIVEFIVENTGTVPHGASIHAAYTQTSKYLGKINPGQSGRVVYRATIPGVYMYHCAPGGHAIPMHVLAGQYGMMVVKPKKETYVMEEVMGRKPDIELYLLQHEFYANGKDAIEGNALYTTFNGKLFRYVEEPIKARPGDFVRINFLNVGPNLLSTFHIVGIVWDYVYWQGQPGMAMPGGQTVTAGPSDSFVIDFRIPPDEGAYTMLTHAVGSAARGAIGLIVAEKDAERTELVTPEGLEHTAEEMAVITEQAVRVISPFQPTDYDQPVTYPPGTREVHVEMIGNSFYPKVIEIEPGTTVTWTNEDAFTYLAGEFAGIHNAAGNDGGDEFFNTPLLAHGETASHVFEVEGTYEYICVPHPYMKARIIVKKSDIDLSALTAGGGQGPGYLLPLVFGTFFIALIALFMARVRT